VILSHIRLFPQESEENLDPFNFGDGATPLSAWSSVGAGFSPFEALSDGLAILLKSDLLKNTS
jgi:hypothetical protein